MHREQIEKLSRRLGNKNVKIFLEVLARESQFCNAISLPIGSELLGDAITELQNAMENILTEKDNEDTRAEVRVLRKIIGRWSTKINDYRKHKTDLDEITGE